MQGSGSKYCWSSSLKAQAERTHGYGRYLKFLPWSSRQLGTAPGRQLETTPRDLPSIALLTNLRSPLHVTHQQLLHSYLPIAQAFLIQSQRSISLKRSSQHSHRWQHLKDQSQYLFLQQQCITDATPAACLVKIHNCHHLSWHMQGPVHRATSQWTPLRTEQGTAEGAAGLAPPPWNRVKMQVWGTTCPTPRQSAAAPLPPPPVHHLHHRAVCSQAVTRSRATHLSRLAMQQKTHQPLQR